MAHKLADLRAQQDALKAEANGLLDKAEKETNGEPTAEQTARLGAIKGELATIEKAMDAEIAKLPGEAISTENAENVGAAIDADAGKKAERQRAADILAACTLVGKADKAAEFVASDKSLSEVVRALQSERAASGSETITTANAGGHQSGSGAQASWDDVATKVNKMLGVAA